MAPPNYCPICDLPSTFVEYNRRPGVYCNNCGSLERHRLVWLYFMAEIKLFDGSRYRMLEVAPTRGLSRTMMQAGNLDYHTIDLEYEAKQKMDVQKMTFPDGHFDGVYASHVLEHVQDDIQAMREIYRVIKPGGWAVLQVPLSAGLTVEHVASVSDENDRRRVYGQRDHRRAYGSLDYRSRLQAQGFAVRVDPYARQLGPEVCRKYGLQMQEDIYFCRKPPVIIPGLQI